MVMTLQAQGHRLVWSGIILVALTLVPAGCSAHRCGQQGCARDDVDFVGEMRVRTELFFGLGLPDGSEVSEDQWEVFVREEITPRFPDGFTILSARGQWRDQHGIHREPARIVIILHEPTAQANDLIEQIRESYKRRFEQTSVLRADSKQFVSF